VPAVAFCYLMYIRGVEIENYRTIGHPSYRPACLCIFCTCTFTVGYYYYS
jgi:hypothetical protein